VLEARGFRFVSQRGSHAKYREGAGHTATVPNPKLEVPIGTTRSIIR
jgi:predicted RNA binding protein YcfA (HicA-like mRNA interferase family)